MKSSGTEGIHFSGGVWPTIGESVLAGARKIWKIRVMMATELTKFLRQMRTADVQFHAFELFEGKTKDHIDQGPSLEGISQSGSLSPGRVVKLMM
jgi:hypothetical protein